MMEAEIEKASWLSQAHDSWMIAVDVFSVILFISFLWINRNQGDPFHERPRDAACESPSCVRCQGFAKSHRLKQRYEAFFSNTDASLEIKTQILSLITDSIEYRDDILLSVYKESGYELNLKEEAYIESLPHIWMLPGLDRYTFWNGNMHKNLHEVVSILEQPENLEAILDEFNVVNQQEEGWKVNSVPLGRWSVFHLYDQGERVDKNANLCPFTSQFLMKTTSFMHKHVYGNAMFSVLEPGSSIEPHTGPCNYRLRCHLPLVIPPGYRIKVGRDISTWKEGCLMIFDDSFVHQVWHEEEVSGKKQEIGRAVFIVDVWHPQVNNDQQAAIKYIYD